MTRAFRPTAQVTVMSTTREFLVMARHNLIPAWFAYVNSYTGTPLRITIGFGIIKGAPPAPDRRFACAASRHVRSSSHRWNAGGGRAGRAGPGRGRCRMPAPHADAEACVPGSQPPWRCACR